MSGVVVTGASGWLGQRVVALLARDASVSQVVAIDRAPAVVAGPLIDHRAMDVTDADQLAAVMQGASGVIHLAWSAEPGISAPATARVLEAAAAAGVASLVHLSSATVYGAWPDNPVPLSEAAPLRPWSGFSFAVEKAEAERLVAEWSGDHPAVAVAVLRPAVTVGSAWPALYRALAGTATPHAGDGARPRQFLHVDDLAEATATAYSRRLRGAYNVAPDGWITEDEARALAGGVGRVRLPGRALRGVRRWVTSQAALPYSEHPWVVANDRLRGAGWTPRFSNEEAVVSTHQGTVLDDLSPNGRQAIVLGAAGAAVLGVAGAAVALANRARSRRG